MTNERDNLIENNMNLVHFIIGKYYPTYRYDEDLVQCGMIGLIHAADRYDAIKGKFSTYASHCISNEIRRELKRRDKYRNEVSLDALMDSDSINELEG